MMMVFVALRHDWHRGVDISSRSGVRIPKAFQNWLISRRRSICISGQYPKWQKTVSLMRVTNGTLRRGI